MDIKKKNVERIRSSRLLGVPALAACMLAAGCASQPVPEASGVTAAPSSEKQPVVAQASDAPTSEVITEPAKPGPVKKNKHKKRKIAAKPKQVATAEKPAAPENAGKQKKLARQKPAAKPKQLAKSKPPAKTERIARLNSMVAEANTNQQAAPPVQDVLLQPAYPSDESKPAAPVPVAPVEAAPIPEPVEPAHIPAPPEPVPAAPVESAVVEPAVVEPAESAPVRKTITPKYNDIMTAVLRSDLEAARELLDLGWWVDKPSASGVTPLMAAVMNRDARMVQLLLEYGAEPTAKALELARKNKDAASAALLEQKGVR